MPSDSSPPEGVIRVKNAGDGVHIIIPRQHLRNKGSISGPLSWLIGGLAMVVLPIVGVRFFHQPGPGFDYLYILSWGLAGPGLLIGLFFIASGIFGLLPMHLEFRVTPTFLIHDRWNGPMRFRTRWARVILTGIKIADERTKRPYLRLKGNLAFPAEFGFGYSLPLLTDLAQELTTHCQWTDHASHAEPREHHA